MGKKKKKKRKKIFYKYQHDLNCCFPRTIGEAVVRCTNSCEQ
jgi:hypothetical protein